MVKALLPRLKPVRTAAPLIFFVPGEFRVRAVVLAIVDLVPEAAKDHGHVVVLAREQVNVLQRVRNERLPHCDGDCLLDSSVQDCLVGIFAVVLARRCGPAHHFALVGFRHAVVSSNRRIVRINYAKRIFVDRPLRNSDVVRTVDVKGRGLSIDLIIFRRADRAICVTVVAIVNDQLAVLPVFDIDARQVVPILLRVAVTDSDSDVVGLLCDVTLKQLRLEVLQRESAVEVILVNAARVEFALRPPFVNELEVGVNPADFFL